MSAGGRKIPCHCPSCGEVHTRRRMEEFLETCESRGWDPVEYAFRGTPAGIRCGKCMERRLAEGMEDGEPMIQRIVARMRNYYRYGVAELPDGKPVTFH